MSELVPNVMKSTSNKILVANSLCNKAAVRKLDVPATTGTPQGSVLVMTDADCGWGCQGSSKLSKNACMGEGRHYGNGASCDESFKKKDMVCLCSSESELMAVVGGTSEGIATRDPWSKMCRGSASKMALCNDSSAALGFV